jgi:hypothetical protein
VVIRVSKVSVVEEPDVADIEDFVVGASEEFSEVLTWLEEVGKPDHGWQVTVSSLEELASELHLVSLLLECRLYNKGHFTARIDCHLLALISLIAWRPINGVILVESANCFEI